jgi:hypothetical protein
LPDDSPTVFRPVRRRSVIHISGFDVIGIDGLDRRLKSGLRKFAALWGATAVSGAPTSSEDGRSVTWEVEAAGPNWQTHCRYTMLRWDEVMLPYVQRSWLGRVVRGYRALFEFVANGTVARYFKANIRYGLFCIYPLLVLAGFLVLGTLAGIAAAALGVPAPAAVAPLIGIAVFVLLMRFLGSYFYLDFALADWAFAADLARDDIPGMDAVLTRFRDEVAAVLGDRDTDEILLSGVSLGAVMLVEAIDRLMRQGRVRRFGRRVAFLTVGSSILKIGLHPAAERLRKAVGRVGAEKSLLWVEYQAKVDPINFYKTDPVKHLGNRPTGRPVVRQIRIRNMMSAEDYRRAQRSSLHMHRQFVMPNARRYFYDFYQIHFGPLPLAARLRLKEAAAEVFAADGAVRPAYIAGASDLAEVR